MLYFNYDRLKGECGERVQGMNAKIGGDRRRGNTTVEVIWEAYKKKRIRERVKSRMGLKKI